MHSDYCQTHQRLLASAKCSYELIWFYEDIEEVFLGRKISDKEKLTAAVEYKKLNTQIYQPKNLKLKGFNETRKKTSNILLILEKYFQYRE